MKKTRFSDNQIVNILNKPNKAFLSLSCAASITSAKVPFTTGAQSMAAWMPL
ncbi:hypothetical protein AOT82_10 [Psychrobacter sp. AntiMn-1]|nr:hypothetical protein AOT82_10 [Psychrobacter sp. AntiMn-1]